MESVADDAAAPITIRRRRMALLGGFLLAIAAFGIAVPIRGLLLDTSAAIPDPDAPGRAPGPLLVRGEPPGSEQRAQEDRQAPSDPLNQVLNETRAMLEDLNEAKAADTELRNEIESLKRENERLAVELAQADTRRIELERSSELAEARIAELTKAADTVRGDAARIDEELTRLRWQNGQLYQSLARADATRKTALAEAAKTRAEMAKELQAARDAAAQSEADLAGLFKELEAKDQELAAAKSAREEVGTRASELEETVEPAAADHERLKAELTALKEQLGQAAGAAIEAKRARQAMSNEVEALRSEAARAREELTAAKTEIPRLTANAQLEKAAWRPSLAIETVRQNLIMIQAKIEEVNAGLDLAPPEGATLAAGAPMSRPRQKRRRLPANQRSRRRPRTNAPRQPSGS